MHHSISDKSPNSTTNIFLSAWEMLQPTLYTGTTAVSQLSVYLISHDLKVCLYIDRWCGTPSVYSFHTFCPVPPPQDNTLHFNGLHWLRIIINCTVVIIVIIITRIQKRHQVYSLTNKVCVTATTTNVSLKNGQTEESSRNKNVHYIPQLVRGLFSEPYSTVQPAKI